MAVLKVKNEKRCKLCLHPRRDDIDVMLERRVLREKDSAGTPITFNYLKPLFEEWGVSNLTEQNVKVHWAKHCERIEGEEVITAQSEVLAALELMKAEGVAIDINSDLDWLWAVWMLEVRQRVAKGEKSGLPVDFGLKVAAEKTRRQHNESQDSLLQALVGGAAAALAQRTLPLGPAPAAEPDEDVVEDAEFAEVPA